MARGLSVAALAAAALLLCALTLSLLSTLRNAQLSALHTRIGAARAPSRPNAALGVERGKTLASACEGLGGVSAILAPGARTLLSVQLISALGQLQVQGGLRATGASLSQAGEHPGVARYPLRANASARAGDPICIDRDGLAFVGYGPFPAVFVGLARANASAAANTSALAWVSVLQAGYLHSADLPALPGPPGLHAVTATAAGALSTAPSAAIVALRITRRLWLVNPAQAAPVACLSDQRIATGAPTSWSLPMRLPCFPTHREFAFSLRVTSLQPAFASAAAQLAPFQGGPFPAPPSSLAAPFFAPLDISPLLVSGSVNQSDFVLFPCRSVPDVAVEVVTDQATFPSASFVLPAVSTPNNTEFLSRTAPSFGQQAEIANTSSGRLYVLVSQGGDGQIDIFRASHPDIRHARWSLAQSFTSATNYSAFGLTVLNEVPAELGACMAASGDWFIATSRLRSGGANSTTLVFRLVNNSFQPVAALSSTQLFDMGGSVGSFRDSCALSADALFVVVGSPVDNKVAVFRRNPGTDTFVAPQILSGTGGFGACVGASGWGLVVGAPTASVFGQVHVFAWNATGDSQHALNATLSGPVNGTQLGASCDMREVGAAVVVAASGRGSPNSAENGAVVVAVRTPAGWLPTASWSESGSGANWGTSLAFVNATRIVVSSTGQSAVRVLTVDTTSGAVNVEAFFVSQPWLRGGFASAVDGYFVSHFGNGTWGTVYAMRPEPCAL